MSAGRQQLTLVTNLFEGQQLIPCVRRQALEGVGHIGVHPSCQRTAPNSALFGPAGTNGKQSRHIQDILESGQLTSLGLSMCSSGLGTHQRVFRCMQEGNRPVAAEAIPGDLKFLGAVAEAHETQDPKNDTNGFGADVFDGAHVDGLAIIAQPVAKVNSLHVQLAEFLASCSTGHKDVEQGVLDVSMAPIRTLDAGDGRCNLGQSRRLMVMGFPSKSLTDVASSKGRSGGG